MLTRICCMSFGALRTAQLTKVEVPVVNSVRWKKRRWATIAPTKLFIVRERTPIDPEEYSELKTRYAHYRTVMRSLKEYFKNELLQNTTSVTEESDVDMKNDHAAWCKCENNAWNEQSAKFREAREKELEKEKQEHDLQLLIKIEQKQKELQEKLRLEVLQTEKESKNFISAGDLVSAIEVALNKRSIYSFAIDKDGKRYIEQPDGSTVAETSEEDDCANALKDGNSDDTSKSNNLRA